MINDYVPNPIDTSNVQLPSALNILVEKMAENVHEEWAKARMEQGWTYGPQRDDVNKKHPCLVPYDQLPDSEKEYDRNTAISTLKLIISMGFNINK
ncbi:RyR domain-containing protein [Lachnospira sp.]|jgi:ryanodine receptor 2|uniref:RyR domain-containing protein n=1 Tax=Lachnospira sp. TaxID=2049031 RepID=UPI00257EC140|nr:RyR domain-containing protein [Lachnospira sp.]